MGTFSCFFLSMYQFPRFYSLHFQCCGISPKAPFMKRFFFQYYFFWDIFILPIQSTFQFHVSFPPLFHYLANSLQFHEIMHGFATGGKERNIVIIVVCALKSDVQWLIINRVFYNIKLCDKSFFIVHICCYSYVWIKVLLPKSELYTTVSFDLELITKL